MLTNTSANFPTAFRLQELQAMLLLIAMGAGAECFHEELDSRSKESYLCACWKKARDASEMWKMMMVSDGSCTPTNVAAAAAGRWGEGLPSNIEAYLHPQPFGDASA